MKRQKNDREYVGEHKKTESYHRQREDAPDTYDALLQLLIISIPNTLTGNTVEDTITLILLEFILQSEW